MTSESKPFWRWTNVSRILGGAMLVGGQFVASSHVKIWQIELESNLIQLSGFLLFFYPMAREVWRMIMDRRRR